MLLIRESAFQIYCAKALCQAEVVDEVIVEDGASLRGFCVTSLALDALMNIGPEAARALIVQDGG